MNFKKIFISLFVIPITYSVVAQKSFTVSPDEFKILIGCWQGTLNYYGTVIRKPHTTTSELVIKQIGKSNKFGFLNTYTKEPNDNSSDTIAISEDCKMLNGLTIKSKRHTGDGNIEVITEVTGFDQDNNKAAILRHTYTLGKHIYTYKKDLRLEGQADWVEREEFKYVRKSCK